MNAACLALVALLSGPPTTVAPGADPVVARAQGPRGTIVVTAARLRNFAQAHPGVPVETLLRDLIDFELLVAEARAVDLHEATEVTFARAQAMVARYLAEVFEKTWAPGNLPMALVRRAYEKNRNRFVHPELRDANHILVSENRERPKDPALDARAKALAEKIYAALEADPPADKAAFLTRAKPFLAEAEAAGLAVDAQALHRFPFRGRYVPAFTEPVFRENQPGLILPPYPTKFGYHVVRLNEVFAPRDDSLEKVEAEVRARIAPGVQRHELRRLADRLAGQYPPLRNANGLARLQNFAPIRALALRRGLPGDAPQSP